MDINFHNMGAEHIAKALQSGRCPNGLSIDLRGNYLGWGFYKYVLQLIQDYTRYSVPKRLRLTLDHVYAVTACQMAIVLFNSPSLFESGLTIVANEVSDAYQQQLLNQCEIFRVHLPKQTSLDDVTYTEKIDSLYERVFAFYQYFPEAILSNKIFVQMVALFANISPEGEEALDTNNADHTNSTTPLYSDIDPLILQHYIYPLLKRWVQDSSKMNKCQQVQCSEYIHHIATTSFSSDDDEILRSKDATHAQRQQARLTLARQTKLYQLAAQANPCTDTTYRYHLALLNLAESFKGPIKFGIHTDTNVKDGSILKCTEMVENHTHLPHALQLMEAVWENKPTPQTNWACLFTQDSKPKDDNIINLQATPRNSDVTMAKETGDEPTNLSPITLRQ